MQQNRHLEAVTAYRTAILVDPSLREPKYAAWLSFKHMPVSTALLVLPVILLVMGISFVVVYFDVSGGAKVGLMFLAVLSSVALLKIIYVTLQKRLLSELKKTDPQLFDLYEKLERKYRI
jgi:ABC-type transport system involved in cytochrome c biogenesis permease subunit